LGLTAPGLDTAIRAQTAACTRQGRFNNSASPANGLYELTDRFDAPTNAFLVGGLVTRC
jgi:hypothetical protein